MHDWQTLEDMYQSTEYDYYIGDKLGNQLFIDDPERAERIAEAAESGSDGSTHAEHIEDWRDFLRLQKVFDPEFDDPEDVERFDLTQEQKKAISAEIDKCEQWHIDHGTIDQQIA